MPDDSIAEVIAHLDTFERDLVGMVAKVREYRYILFSSLQADSLDIESDGV